MTLEDLMGSHILSGVEIGSESYKEWQYEGRRNFIKFTLDGVTYIAKEDPSDGYRSYLEDLEIVEGKCKVPLPNIRVLCRMRTADEQWWSSQVDEILSFLDAENGKEILAIGTANTNDYYPYCVLEYHPENMACNSLVNKEEEE